MKISRSQAEYSIAPWVLDSAVQITSDNIDNMGIAKYSLLILERIRDRYETIKEIGTELQNTRLKVEK